MTSDRAGDFGLRDPDQPTEAATKRHQERMRSEFTPAERYQIRLRLGLTAFTEGKTT